MPLTYDEALALPLPPDHDDQVRARHHARAARRWATRTRSCRRSTSAGPTARAASPRWWPRRCARRVAGRTLHVAPPGLVPRAHPGGRRADRRGRDGDVDRAAPAAHPRAQGDLLRGHHRHRLRRLRRPRRGDRGGRGGAGRPARQHQRAASAGERGDQDRARPHEVSGRHARADRRREGRHRQARDAVRDRRAGPGAGGRAPARGAEGGGARSSRAAGPTSACCRPTTSGAARSASRARTSGGTRRSRTASSWRCPRPTGRRSRPSTRASRAARVPGRLDRRGKWLFDVAHNPDGIRALVRVDRDPPPAAPAARAGLDPGRQGVARDAGAARPGDRPRRAHGRPDGREPGLERRVAPPLAPRPRPPAGAGLMDAGAGVPRRAERCSEGAGTVLVTGSFHTVGDVMAALGMEVV